MASVEVVRAYKCPLCQSLALDRDESEKCYQSCQKKALERKQEEERRARAREYSDRPRLEAESFDHAWELVSRYALDLMGLKFTLTNLTLNFCVVPNTHNCPVGGECNFESKRNKAQGYLGWRGWMEGKVRIVRGLAKCKESVSLHSVIGGGFFDYTVGFCFRGFHTGTGCPGKDFGIGYEMFIDDFPKIRDRYKTLCLTHGVACRLAGSAFRNKEFSDLFETKHLLENSKCSTAR